MRCVFCKKDSSHSVSVEHIIPESLGNKEHILPRRWVCDQCNNYFSLKVEGPFLNSTYGKNVRGRMRVENKRGRIPPLTAVHLGLRSPVDIIYSNKEIPSIVWPNKSKGHQAINLIKNQQKFSLLIPCIELPTLNHEISRFIAKVAFEAFVHKCIEISGWNDAIVDMSEFDPIRNYCRDGSAKDVWPVSIRKIYPEEKLFPGENSELFQVLHEWCILPIELDGENFALYMVVGIFGIEYAINLEKPESEKYMIWVKDNNGRSILTQS